LAFFEHLFAIEPELINTAIGSDKKLHANEASETVPAVISEGDEPPPNILGIEGQILRFYRGFCSGEDCRLRTSSPLRAQSVFPVSLPILEFALNATLDFAQGEIMVRHLYRIAGRALVDILSDSQNAFAFCFLYVY